MMSSVSHSTAAANSFLFPAHFCLSRSFFFFLLLGVCVALQGAAVPYKVTTPWCGVSDKSSCSGSTYSNVFEQLLVAERYLFVTSLSSNKVSRYDSLTDTFIPTYVGSGASTNAEGTGPAAKMWIPLGLALSPDWDYLFVGRAFGVSLVALNNASLTFLAGHPSLGGYYNIRADHARFGGLLSGLVMEPWGLVVADRENHALRLINHVSLVGEGKWWKRDPELRWVWELAGSGQNPGWVDGVTSAARFNKPTLLRRGKSTLLYIFESGNQAIRCLNTEGVSYVVSTIYVTGFEAAIEVSFDESTVWYASETAVYALNVSTTGSSPQLIAGSAFSSGYSNGVGTAVRFRSLWSMRRLGKGCGGTLLLGANGRIREMTLA